MAEIDATAEASPSPPRHDGWTVARRKRFLETLGTAGNVRDACRTVGLTGTSAYRLRGRDADFAAAWDAALERASVSLEAVAHARAVDGVEEPVFHAGKQVGTRIKRSDALLRLLLQASNPEKYGRTGAGAANPLAADAIGKIRRDAYVHAWRCFESEYRCELANELLHRRIMWRLAHIHRRMCGNALCPDCHPERLGRAIEWEPRPGPDHDPIEPEVLGTPALPDPRLDVDGPEDPLTRHFWDEIDAAQLRANVAAKLGPDDPAVDLPIPPEPEIDHRPGEWTPSRPIFPQDWPAADGAAAS